MHETYWKHKNHYQGPWQPCNLTFQPSIKNMNMNKGIEYEKNVPIEWDFIHNMKELETWHEVNVEDYVEKSYLKVLCLDWKQCNAFV
jgi:hypothetical protein